MAIKVGRWDCEHCGQQGILGPETKCTNCGSNRPEDVRFYLPKDARYVKDEQKIKEAKAGANWDCSFCGSDNLARATVCSSCGNARTAAEERLEIREYGLGETPDDSEVARGLELEDDRASGLKPIHPETEYRKAFNQHKKKKKTNKSFLWIGGILLTGFIILIVLTFIQKEISVEVTKMHWERTIETEQYKEVMEEGWSVPSGGRMTDSYRAVHHTEKVFDGYETRTREVKEQVGTERYVCGQRDLGNGYFEDKYCDRPVYETRTEEYQVQRYREEPVYKTKYRYAIFKWMPAGTIKTSGNDKNPEWGDLSLIENDKNRRERNRTEDYRIKVMDEKGKTHEEKLSFSRWKSLKLGDELPAKRNGLGQYQGIIHK